MKQLKIILFAAVSFVALWVVEKPTALGESLTIRIAAYSDSPEIRKAFLKTHPNVVFEDVYLKEGQSYPLDYVRGKESVDILRITSSSGLFRLIREELVQDLSASPIIREQFETYIPQIQTILSHDGKLMAIAIGIDFNAWEYDKEKWNKYDLPNLPKTYDELFDFLLIWEKSYQKQFPNLRIISAGGANNYKTAIWEAVTKQYAIEHATGKGPVNFDTPEYRLIMERLIGLPTFELYEFGALLRFSAFRQMLYASVSTSGSEYGYEQYIDLMPLQVDGHGLPKVGATLFALCLSSNAQSPELALEYLSFMAAYYNAYRPDVVYSFTGGAEPLPTFPLSSALLSSMPASELSSDGIKVPAADLGKYEMIGALQSLYKEVLPYLTFALDPSGALRMDQESEGAKMPWEEGFGGIQTTDELILELNEAAKLNWQRYHGE